MGGRKAVLIIEKIKCPNCGKTLMFANSADVEIKCPRCKEIINIKYPKTEPIATRKQ